MDRQSESKVQYYLNHISAYEREFRKWESRVEKILQRYRDDKRERSEGARFNVLWSNVQTLKAATFSRMPRPDVSRMHSDNDQVGRVAGLILERALDFEIRHYKDFGASIRQCIYDRFLGGRGSAWVRYEPIFTSTESAEQVTEDVESESDTSEQLDFEAAPVDYVHWRDFGHSVARSWEEVTIVWRRVYMGRSALKKRFGDDGAGIPLDAMPEESKTMRGSTDTDSVQKRALIYEIWDKDSGSAIWLSKSLNKIIDEKDDPLQLEEFFPCPPPLYSTVTPDSMVPLPDYTLYQDQAKQLDVLADRIDGLVNALQLKGVYDASVPELARLFTEGANGDLIPVKNWQAFAEKRGLSGTVDLVEILQIAQTLAEAYKAFEQIKNQIYELTGIADILRGQTNAYETATAQQIKNSYASMRLKVYQDEVERFASRLLQLKAQIICSKFDDSTIGQMASVDQMSDADKSLVPQAFALLRQRIMRMFRIEVSTDSMVYLDESQEKQDRLEFLSATSQFIEKIVQAGQAAPQLVPLAIEMLKFGVSGFRAGKLMEGLIDQTAEQVKAQISQQANSPPSDPDAAKAQADQQSEQMRIQAQTQIEQFKAQSTQEIEQRRLLGQQQSEAQEQQHQAALEQMKLQMNAQTEASRQEFERWKTQIDNDTKVLIAQIQAGAKAASAAEGGIDDQKGTDMPDEAVDETANPTSEAINMIMQQLIDLSGAVSSIHQKMHAGQTVSIERIRDPQSGRLIGGRIRRADGSTQDVPIQ